MGLLTRLPLKRLKLTRRPRLMLRRKPRKTPKRRLLLKRLKLKRRLLLTRKLRKTLRRKPKKLKTKRRELKLPNSPEKRLLTIQTDSRRLLKERLVSLLWQSLLFLLKNHSNLVLPPPTNLLKFPTSSCGNSLSTTTLS